MEKLAEKRHFLLAEYSRFWAFNYPFSSSNSLIYLKAHFSKSQFDHAFFDQKLKNPEKIAECSHFLAECSRYLAVCSRPPKNNRKNSRCNTMNLKEKMKLTKIAETPLTIFNLFNIREEAQN